VGGGGKKGLGGGNKRIGKKNGQDDPDPHCAMKVVRGRWLGRKLIKLAGKKSIALEKISKSHLQKTPAYRKKNTMKISSGKADASKKGEGGARDGGRLLSKKKKKRGVGVGKKDREKTNWNVSQGETTSFGKGGGKNWRGGKASELKPRAAKERKIGLRRGRTAWEKARTRTCAAGKKGNSEWGVV